MDFRTFSSKRTKKQKAINKIASFLLKIKIEFLNIIDCKLIFTKMHVQIRNRTRDDFITESREIFGDLYDYSKVVYINTITPVTIICSVHKEFQMKPTLHLQGRICPKCVTKGIRYTKDKFIEAAQKIHGDKYDYTPVVYINTKTIVTIRCPRHGLFKQKPFDHLAGCQCQKCSDESKIEKLSYTTDQYIAVAKTIHGDRYRYTMVKYVNSRTKVTIECIRHGYFTMRAGDHTVNKQGCSKCNNSIGEDATKLQLSKLNIQFNQQAKFATCKDKLCLPFDFDVPDYNLLIEFDGKQHFQLQEHFGEKNFKSCKSHDSIKDNWCLTNGKFLLRISHKDIDNIEDIIKSALNKIKTFSAEEPDPANPRGFIMGTAFYSTICTTTNPDGIRDTSHYVIL